jgi:uncharacterized membrane protein
MAEEQLPSAVDELAALGARVAQLERQVAELTRTAPMPAAPPPLQQLPPMPPIPRRQPEPPPSLGAQIQTAAAERSLEDRLGSQIFNLIGIVAIIIGASWFLKLAIERGWLGPLARVLIGLVAGAGFVLWSERFRRKGFAAFSYSLKALGSGVLYLSLWAAFHLYHLLPASVALLAMILVTAWNGFMAWSQDSELLAGYGLLGGFATPLLLSTGGNHETFLFTYIAAIDLATVLLMRGKPWRRLLIPGFAATVGYFIGWYAAFFSTGESWTSDSTETAAFAILFAAIFAVVSLKGFSTLGPDTTEIIAPVLIPLANAAFLGCALYSVLQDSGCHDLLAWMMVALAAVYLGLMRLQATAIAAAMHLAAAVIFLTIAIPLKASGHTLTTAWLIEGLVLYWASTRFEGAPAKVLSLLSLGGYTLGLAALTFDRLWLNQHVDFLNAALGSALVALVALAGAAWLALHPLRRDLQTLSASLIAIDLVALLLLWREVVLSNVDNFVHPAFANPEFVTAFIGLVVLASVAWVSFRMATSEQSLATIAGATFTAFNLLAILTVEREIGALWTRSEANLQRSLAISGFLMAYAAALLAAGFWRRSAFVRWQGLVLLLFTIAKVFLYDISGLSQGYRVASFLALGALLMAVSFAYQKDWLGLKQPDSGPAE